MSCYVVPPAINVMSAAEGRPSPPSVPNSAGQSNSVSPQRQQRTVSVKPVSTRADLLLALTVRSRVFVQELGVPQNHEFDAFDGWPIQEGITHFLVLNDRYPIATCRINTMLGNGAKLERLAVDRTARRRGVGRALLSHVERTHLLSNLTGPFTALVPKDQEAFYKNSGWLVEEGHVPYSRPGLPHFTMIRRRRPKGAATELSLSHTMIKTIDISRAMRFYSLLGFKDVRRFKTSGVRAAWLESPYIDLRIELMEVKTLISADDPSLQVVPGLSDYKPGMGHISIDVSRACTDLTKFLTTMQTESVARFRMGLRVLEKPKQLMLGRLIVEITFLSDADGTMLELMRIINKLERQDLDSEW